ncbi:MAG: serine acetyltransferase [Clostridiales bacterium]|nr:serine acetyltransferase [Clostridiales bacterium]
MGKFNPEIEAGKIVEALLEDYKGDKFIDHVDMYNKPDKAEVQDLVHRLLQIVFPGYFRDKTFRIYNTDLNFAAVTEDIFYRLHKQVSLALNFNREGNRLSREDADEQAYFICKKFFEKLPMIREYVDTDLQAAFDGDPAAGSKEEVILAYPGMFVITVARLAHELYLMKVPVLPRLMTEYAHSETGTDIHPGATMGKYFFIDHCTGVVIGETTIIGEHVKLYQGVTLGALSTKAGQKLHGVQRHPTIEDNVTIYSGASVLGGNTVIGENCIIGGNVFITSSVPRDTVVTAKNQEQEYRKGDRKTSRLDELDQEETWYYNI